VRACEHVGAWAMAQAEHRREQEWNSLLKKAKPPQGLEQCLRAFVHFLAGDFQSLTPSGQSHLDERLPTVGIRPLKKGKCPQAFGSRRVAEATCIFQTMNSLARRTLRFASSIFDFRARLVRQGGRFIGGRADSKCDCPTHPFEPDPDDREREYNQP
jgi:hypothetical protein